MENITVSACKDYCEAEVLRLYDSVGWTAYTCDPPCLRRAFENSLLVLAARDGGTLTGLIRIVGDGCTIVYIQDLLVLPEYQRRGIGTALLQAALREFPNVRQKVLLTDSTAENLAFYRSAGFEPVSSAGCTALLHIPG